MSTDKWTHLGDVYINRLEDVKSGTNIDVFIPYGEPTSKTYEEVITRIIAYYSRRVYISNRTKHIIHTLINQFLHISSSEQVTKNVMGSGIIVTYSVYFKKDYNNVLGRTKRLSLFA